MTQKGTTPKREDIQKEIHANRSKQQEMRKKRNTHKRTAHKNEYTQ